LTYFSEGQLTGYADCIAASLREITESIAGEDRPDD
jgi:hypothetical protein